VWKDADGLFKAPVDIHVTFKPKKQGGTAYAKVDGETANYSTGEEKRLFIPAGKSCEMLGCRAMIFSA
jgi:hypothetical protein